MKVQCETCDSTYNIPEDKIPDTEVKLQCIKCPNTILINSKNPKNSAETLKESTKSTESEIQKEENETDIHSPAEDSVKYSVESTVKEKSKTQQNVIEDDIQSEVERLPTKNEKNKIVRIGNKLKGKFERIRDDLSQPKLPDGKNEQKISKKSFIEKIEQKLLFNYTRVLALISIVFLFICLPIGIISFTMVGNDSFVAYKDVVRSLNSTEKNANKTIQDRFPDVKIPNNALRYFSDGENKKVMTGWLSGLEKDQKKDFLSNLEYMIDEAEDENPSKVINYINGYKELKFAKIKTNPFDEYFQTATKVGIIALLLVLMALIGLFSLVLVVLSVERNTRPNLQIE